MKCSECGKESERLTYMLGLCSSCNKKRMQKQKMMDEKFKMNLLKKGYSPEFVNSDFP